MAGQNDNTETKMKRTSELQWQEHLVIYKCVVRDEPDILLGGSLLHETKQKDEQQHLVPWKCMTTNHMHLVQGTWTLDWTMDWIIDSILDWTAESNRVQNRVHNPVHNPVQSPGFVPTP